ncbi:tight adherence pilus pseudopilin TadF [Pasteurella skyensis]|uniref:Tight adherence pilus pseudopilin TadF n=1 Tax=Phocoenobacter skyensis TaxID=97481 RepID=A0AAJ6NE20_9PAST|nr:tight adherence pilus pseudopilin TadF [Pasteurella skyensis]MDP8170830.1 tight adherence pilus pseudopilin TadF [Pasteurella skyensis]MDP8174936.1 tight adherence pilus pseudopilin TadF [Pasteurella skyensis]
MKEHNLKKSSQLWLFIKNSKGAVAIEFVFMIILLTFMLVFMVDLAMLRSNLGKLDNMSYSLVNVLRERTQLYGKGNESFARSRKVAGKLENRDITNFRKLAKYMAFGNTQSDKELFLVLESLQFQRSSPTAEPVLNYTALGDTGQCAPATNLQNLKAIAPRSEIDERRTIPLYQVTVCLKNYSIFRAIVLDESEQSGRLLRSSSVAVAR